MGDTSSTTGRCLRTLEGHSSSVLSIAWDPTPGSTTLASGSYDKTIKIWDTTTASCLRTLEGHRNWVPSIAWDPTLGSTTLASGSGDNSRQYDPGVRE